MENVAREQGLDLQQLFSIQIFLVFRNSNVHKISFFIAKGLKPGHFDIVNMLFPFLAFLMLQPIIL